MSASPQAQSAPSPVVVFETLMAFRRSAALNAAIELDVFRAIGEGLHDVKSLAARCDASERGMRILCDFLTVIELLEKRDGLYHHTPASQKFLDPASPACLASTARFLGSPMLHEPYTQLSEIVRTGRTTLSGDGSVEPENPIWVEFARSMAPMMAPVAGPLASMVLEARNGPVTVLDIAAGHGLFGIEVAKRNPQARIVAVDWAPVLEVARENAQNAGVENRYELRPGSAFDVDFGGSYDAVLITNFLHHFDPATCVELLRKVHDSLKPSGVAATLEFVPNDDRVSPPVPASFSLVMLASTVAGDAYTFRELESMYQQAGFTAITCRPIPESPHTAVLGARPN